MEKVETKKRGRKPMLDDQKRAHLNITLDREVKARLELHCGAGRVARVVEALIIGYLTSVELAKNKHQ